MELYYEIAGAQIDGARELQEDAFLTTFVDVPKHPAQSVALVVVTDGMGGHAAGNIASNLVVSTFNKHFTSHVGKKPPHELLNECLMLGNQALEASIRETPALHGMGCTMVGGAVIKGKLYWISVGDSHLYHMRDGTLEQRNEDHSYGGYLDRLRADGLDPKPERGFSRHMLMSAMTGDEIAEIDNPEEGAQLLAEDRLILATDGIDTLGPERIASISSGAASPRDCVQMLLNAVEKENKPRQDNTTVVVLDVLERVAKPVEPRTTKPSMVIERRPDKLRANTPKVDTSPLARGAVGGAAGAKPASGGGAAKLVGAILVMAAAAAGGWYYLQTQAPPAPPPVVSATEPATDTAPRLTTPDTLPSGTRESFADGLSIGGTGPRMVPVPAAVFEMGGTSGVNEADERPPREVTLNAFAIGESEVTVAEYARFARASNRRIPAGYGGDAESEPVTDVSWRDAAAYARWLSVQTGKNYRLPTEAEWEFAAGVGANSAYWWGRRAGVDNARCFDCSTQLEPVRPAAVKSFVANPLGLYDTAGNVGEWVRDCYRGSYEGAPTDGSAVEFESCSERVVRGGDYTTTSPALRSASRARATENARHKATGIRVARDAD